MLNQKQIEEYCLKKKGVTKDYKEEWEVTRLLITDKMFLMIGQDNKMADIVTMKCDPEIAEVYRKQYKDVVPGYYMNKQHWNSIYLNGDVPNDVIEEMLDMAYTSLLEKLPKKLQKEIIEK